MKKATNAQILNAYKKSRTCKGAGRLLGMCGQSVHERLRKMGVKLFASRFTAEDCERLRRDYELYRMAGRLGVLAKEMGRPATWSLSQQAMKLGLTNPKGPKMYLRTWKGMDEASARKWFNRFNRTRMGVLRFCAKHNIDNEGFSKTMRLHFPDEWDAAVESRAPKQSMYRLGRHFEYRVRDVLKSAGYFVLRSPRSGSPIDLVAIRPNEVVFVQCKRSGVIVSREWNTIFDLALSAGAIPVLAEMDGCRGTLLWEMTGRKDGKKQAQPRKAYVPGARITVRKITTPASAGARA